MLRICGAGRRFGGVTALEAIDLVVRAGEVLAIVGENGAGKSTLLRILSGVLEPSTGSMEWVDRDGSTRPLRLRGVRDATRAGIALVHQELNLAGHLDLAGAMFLGREPRRFGFLDRPRMRAEALRWLGRVGLDESPDATCDSLSIAARQQVEIARALSTNARILVLDEPTSSLSQRETDRLLAILRELAGSGVAVVFVSHHLNEVMEIADRVVVLRDGRLRGELQRTAIKRSVIESLMVGREVAARPTPLARTAPSSGPASSPRLAIRRLMPRGRRAHPVSFDVRAGEIVGLAGLVGAGRTEVLEAIAGVRASTGTACVDGAPLVGGPSKRRRRGLALVPEDRARNGLFPLDSVSVNLSLAWLGRGWRGAFVDRRAEREVVRDCIVGMGVRPADPSRAVSTLSGGNQQKTLFGRSLLMAPRAFLLDEPTRGVDVGAREEIHAAIRAAAASGAAVLFASSELEEVLFLSDRIVVMHQGAVAGELPGPDATEEQVMHLATGGAAA